MLVSKIQHSELILSIYYKMSTTISLVSVTISSYYILLTVYFIVLTVTISSYYIFLSPYQVTIFYWLYSPSCTFDLCDSLIWERKCYPLNLAHLFHASLHPSPLWQPLVCPLYPWLSFCFVTLGLFFGLYMQVKSFVFFWNISVSIIASSSTHMTTDGKISLSPLA